MNRIQVINNLISKNNYLSYLEIGCEYKKNCFDKILCKQKTSVDPSKVDTYGFNVTSDHFFFDINTQK